MIDLPAQLYCGSIPPGDVWKVLVTQLAWAVVLIVAGRAVTKYGLKKTVLAGG